MKSDLTYERLARGELTTDLNEEDRRQLAQMDREDQDFLRRHPLLPAKASKKLPWTSWAGLAAAALLLVVGGTGVLTPPETTRVKSAELSLLVYHKTSEGTELLKPQTPLSSGDEIQFAYFVSEKGYAAILSVDGRGTVTTHFPLHGSQAPAVETSRPELLPYSYKLDDAPEFETVYLITSNEAFEPAKLRPFLIEMVQSHRTEPVLPDGFTVASFPIAKKESSR